MYIQYMYMCKQDLALDILPGLMYDKTQTTGATQTLGGRNC